MKKYAYEIHQLIEISNVLYRITYDPDNSKGKNIVDKSNHPLHVIIAKYPNKLTDIALNIFSESIEELKITHFDKIDLSSSPEKNQSQEAINYIKEFKNMKKPLNIMAETMRSINIKQY